MANASDKQSYLQALDGLRAVAILLVMCSHLISQQIFPGHFGVTLFFFISGFIITRHILSSRFGFADLGSFYARRLFRLTPALFSYIALTSLIVWAVGGNLPPADALSSIFYLSNYHAYSKSVVDTISLSPLEMTWSLAVEEHFYLLFPIIILASKSRRALFWYSFIIVASVLVWRLYLFRIGVSEWALNIRTDTRLDSILYGCMLSIALHLSEWDLQIRKIMELMSSRVAVLIGFCLLVLSFSIRDSAFRATFRYSLQGIAFVPIFCLLFRTESKFLGMRMFLTFAPMRFIGRISYSLYLYHILCWLVVLRLGLGHLLTAALVFGSSIPLAFLSYRFIEQPGRKYGARAIQSLRTNWKRRVQSRAPVVR